MVGNNSCDFMGRLEVAPEDGESCAGRIGSDCSYLYDKILPFSFCASDG